MSIRKMISLHPAVKASGHVNEPLGTAVHHAMYCAKMALSCAEACAAEGMSQCARTCNDCADVCEATARLGLRRSGDNNAILIEMLEFCARVCEACAAECEKHDHDHCRLCAQMCRECAEDCRLAAQSITVG